MPKGKSVIFHFHLINAYSSGNSFCALCQENLWALNVASDKAIPVVIDTPLARIDKEHQNRLLTNYYPNVARQVIILPTDSEIDDEKLALITPHVYKKFALDNPDGKTTSLALID